MNKIIDSNLPAHEVLRQNPDMDCPKNILETIGVMEVNYIGFDQHGHIGQIAVAQSVMSEVESFFQEAYALRFPISKVIPAADPRYAWSDERLMADNASSGFDYRLIAGTQRPSLHGRGLAFDINPLQNPYIRYEARKTIVKPDGAQYDPNADGTLHESHPLVKLMEGFGWEWGGHWTSESGRTDYQHFQKSM